MALMLELAMLVSHNKPNTTVCFYSRTHGCVDRYTVVW